MFCSKLNGLFSLKFFYYQSSFLLILSIVEFVYLRWQFLDILATLRESLYSNLFVLNFVAPFLILALYVFFIISFTLSLFTYNLFYTHIFADSSPSLQLMEGESADSCPLYPSGVVREFLPRFTGVMVACIFIFVWGIDIPTCTLYVTLLIIGMSLCILL